MPIKWGIIYETVDNKSANHIKSRLRTLLGGETQVIPGVHLLPRETDQTLCQFFVVIQEIGKDIELKNKVKQLRLIRLTDDSDMMPAIDKSAYALKAKPY